MTNNMTQIAEIIKDDNDLLTAFDKFFSKPIEKEEQIVIEAMCYPFLKIQSMQKILERAIPEERENKNFHFIASSEHIPDNQIEYLEKKHVSYHPLEVEQFTLKYAPKGFYWSDFASRDSELIFIYPHFPEECENPHDHFGFRCFDKEITSKINSYLLEIIDKIENKQLPIILEQIEKWVNNRFFDINIDNIFKRVDGRYVIKKEYIGKKIVSGKLFDQKSYDEHFNHHPSIPYRNEIELDPLFIRG